MSNRSAGPWSRGFVNPLAIVDGDGSEVAEVSHYLAHHIGFNLAGYFALLMASSPDLLGALTAFVDHGYCPSCGCDLWNTKGCPTCPDMRRAYDVLVKLGLRPRREYAEYADPDPVNIANLQMSAAKKHKYPSPSQEVQR